MTSLLFRSARLLVLGGAFAFCASLAPACSSNPAASLCRDVCDCEGCSESEEDECIEAADEAQTEADDEDCSEEFDSYLDCRKSAFKCDDGDAVFTEDCASEAEDLVDCGAMLPGTGNVCDRATVLCGGEPGQGEPADCSGDVECAAQCIVDTNSCDFGADPQLNDCVSDCVGGF